MLSAAVVAGEMSLKGEMLHVTADLCELTGKWYCVWGGRQEKETETVTATGSSFLDVGKNKPEIF